MINIESVDFMECSDIPTEHLLSIYTFLERYPTAQDADHRHQIYVYKPPGWPEELQPQYRNAPCHILSIEGCWIKVKWNRFNEHTYNHPDWKKRLLFTHWKPITKPINGFLFKDDRELHPSVPQGLQWDTVNWSEAIRLVDAAQECLAAGDYADRHMVQELHTNLLRVLEIDDPFLLNQWMVAVYRHGWIEDCRA